MCSLIGLFIALGVNTSDCMELTQPGYDATTSTSATEIGLSRGEKGYKITCNQETQLCIRRAEAICAGNYRMIDDPVRRPRAQAFIDGKIVTVKTDNPSSIIVACIRQPGKR
jgi:hypothetical protein